MYIVFLIGRIIVAGFFLMAAFNHFKNLSMYASYALSKGTPAPRLAVGGAGVLLLLGGLSLLLGYHPTRRGPVGHFPDGCLVPDAQFLGR